MMDFDCSIIVRAYNEEAHLGRLLSGLNQQSTNNFEVLLIDSGSTDETVSIAESDRWNFPVRILHIHPDQFSFGRSLNLGIQHALSDIIVIASAHVYPVYPDWIERIISPFTDEQVGLSYGKQRGGKTTRFPEHQIFARWFPDQSKVQTTNPFCNNANAAIRKDLWRAHPYDESLSGLEDLEWAKWAIDNEHHIVYVAEAEIIHLHEDNPKGVFNRYRREAMAFKRIFPHEKFGMIHFFQLFLSNVINDSSVAFREGRLVQEFLTINWFRWMQFWGTYRGYQQSGPLTQELRQTFYYPGDRSKKISLDNRSVKPIQYED
jgi:rhamnosyltransferase